VLSALTAGALADAESRREDVSYAQIEHRALAASPALDAAAALRRSDTMRLIAEIKRSSPSKGTLASIVDPAALAAAYARGGASAISVLTEGRKFGGSLADLAAVRDAVSIPILRKDFISIEYQILEARAFGADLALLIVAALDQKTLSRLHDFVLQLGMTPLVETHTSDEVLRANDIGAQLIGVNARNLSTFELDTSLFGQVRHLIPDGITAVAESAVFTVDDVQHYRDAGADAVLVGEALVKDGNPVERVAQFVGVS
jgi:indole-3-glycerol phosphate synthase